MKDFLPILIGIIWLGYKYYQKNQKKIEEQRAKASVNQEYQEPPKVNPQAEKAVKSLDSFMTTFFGEEANEILKTPVNQPQEYASVEDNYSEVEAYSNDSKPIDSTEEWNKSNLVSVETTKETAHQKTLNRQKIMIETEESPEDKDIMDDFDIEKAIIYNAILNRPYA
ncbi:MAG: hypothetical protein DRI74_09585 [Bacteroidetes bacterium]|nr:MAG: hypothetical protein DRI74_09585 [Bacteroidota bacterium]